MTTFPYSTNKTPVNATSGSATTVFTIPSGTFLFSEIAVDNTNAGAGSGSGSVSFDGGTSWAPVPASACIFYHGVPIAGPTTVLLQADGATAMSNVKVAMH